MEAQLPLHIDSTMIYKEFQKKLRYDTDSGLFYWRESASNGKVKAGAVAGTLHNSGYIRIQIKVMGKIRAIFAHKLVWFFETGNIAGEELDHINRDRRDNRFSNLRMCSHQENAFNRTVGRNNTSGQIGVCFHKRILKWQAYIFRDGRQIHLGYFTSKEEAERARTRARGVYHV